MRQERRYCAGRFTEKVTFSCSTMTGYGIPHGMCINHSCRVYHLPNGRLAFLMPESYDKLMTRDQARELDILHGRLTPYGRNSCGFVMSRAARKRGMTTAHYLYNSTVKRHSR